MHDWKIFGRDLTPQERRSKITKLAGYTPPGGDSRVGIHQRAVTTETLAASSSDTQQVVYTAASAVIADNRAEHATTRGAIDRLRDLIVSRPERDRKAVDALLARQNAKVVLTEYKGALRLLANAVKVQTAVRAATTVDAQHSTSKTKRRVASTSDSFAVALESATRAVGEFRGRRVDVAPLWAGELMTSLEAIVNASNVAA